MVLDEEIEMIRKVTPSKRVLDFGLMPDRLSSEEKFKSEIQAVCGDEKLPLVFPGIPDYFKARNEGMVTNSELRDSELSMPAMLYDSETYANSPELRGPMEELILGYEKERIKHGLTKRELSGMGGVRLFVKDYMRFNIRGYRITKSMKILMMRMKNLQDFHLKVRKLRNSRPLQE
jgi:hypothetical protein